MSKTKKIFIVAVSRFDVPSGICRYAFNLAKILSGINGISITLVVGKWQEKYYRESFDWSGLEINLKVVNIANHSLSRNFWFVFILPFIAIQHKIDALFLSFPIPFIKVFKYPLKVITSIHDLYAFEFPENFKYPFFNRLFTLISARNANYVSALSYTTEKKIRHLLPQFTSKTIVNYTPFAYSENFLSTNPKADGEYVLSVAQHRKNKNLDILIKAFTLAKEQSKDFTKKMVIIGSEGPETEYLKTLCKGFESEVIFKHGISEEELILAYQNASCFALLSSNEGLGIPLIESLFYCKYIICSDIEVFREIDESNCNFVDLNQNPVEQMVNYLLSDLKPNLKFGTKDDRFIIGNIRKKYESLIK